MGSTSRAQQASMRRCPGAAGPQYSMYPVDIRCAQPNGEGESTSKMVLHTCSDWIGAHYRTCTVRRTLVCSDADTSLWRKGTPRSVTTLF